MPRNQLLRICRVTHLYFGVFIAPAVLFFAFTGALQTFGLHETNRDHPNYKPAHWIAVLAQIHKKQTDVIPVRRPQSASAAPSTLPSPAVPASSTLRDSSPTSASGAASGTAAETADRERRHHHRDADLGALGTASTKAAPTTIAQPSTPPTTPAIAHRNPLPMRIFFLIVCIGLLTSTLTGLYMSYRYTRNKVLVTVTLVAGVVLPPLLLLV